MPRKKQPPSGASLSSVGPDLERLSTGLYQWWRAEAPVSSTEWKLLDTGPGQIACVPLKRMAPYNVRESAALALAKRDPLLSPHGFFRALPHGKNRAAIEFVETFGPLEWPDGAEGSAYLVFGDFWRKHLRYVSVVRLWEAKDNDATLRRAFNDLHLALDSIEYAEGVENTPTSAEPRWPVGSTSDTPGSRPTLPWRHHGEDNFQQWIAAASTQELSATAIHIFHAELNVHVRDRQPRWGRRDLWGLDAQPSFQLFLSRGSLWSYIWELTGLDTGGVSFWRICPGCNTLFYPKRSDQFYCKSQEQVLASKRVYARNRRRRERLARMARERGKR